MSFMPSFQERSTTVDLTTDSSLLVDISDALSEKDKVKFTVHTKVRMKGINTICVYIFWLKFGYEESLIN